MLRGHFQRHNSKSDKIMEQSDNDILGTENENAINDSDLGLLANAARDPNDFVGRPLKFKKGKWSILREKDSPPEEVDDTETFLVDARSYDNGWVKWENKRPTIRQCQCGTDCRTPNRKAGRSTIRSAGASIPGKRTIRSSSSASPMKTMGC
jgi:hypothetical protein